MTSSKPRLAFFQNRYSERLPVFLRTHVRDHVRCLEHFFDVTVIHDDCDYAKVCDEVEPDVSLFELGVNHETCRRPRVANLNAAPSIPKLALHNADAFCNARAGLFSDLEHYGIEAVFAISTTAAEHNPELAESLFAWPNFIDSAIYRDYQQWKSIPVLITGNQNELYPWRQQVTSSITHRYPSLVCPHPGYEPNTFKGLTLHGEPYARTINASLVVPACGTVAKELVRKHLEVPACRSCLLAEPSAALEAAGFIDMVNCVLAEADQVIEKMDYLFRNPEELARITLEGFKMVHERHTMAQRDQLLRWLELKRQLKPGEKIVQLGPFGAMAISPREGDGATRNDYVVCRGAHLRLIEKGDECLAAGRIPEAKAAYEACLNYMPWMPEPHLRRGLCNLYSGRPSEAIAEIRPLLSFILESYEALDPDPVEWASYILALLCAGKLKEAKARVKQFHWVSHPQLDRIRWLMDLLGLAKAESKGTNRRRTIHVFPEQSFQEWARQTEKVLRTCGKNTFADKLAAAIEGYNGSGRLPADFDKEQARNDHDLAGEGSDRAAKSLSIDGRGLGSRIVKSWRESVASVKGVCRRAAGQSLQLAETRFGVSLPFKYSILRKDRFYSAIKDIARDGATGCALIIDAAMGNASTEALMAGASENKKRLSLFCIATGSGQRRNDGLSEGVEWHAITEESDGDLASIDSVVTNIMNQRSLAAFGAIVMAGQTRPCSGDRSKLWKRWLSSAKWIFLDRINDQPNWERHQWLFRQPEAELVACDPGVRQGYSIFRWRRAGNRVPAG